MENLSKVGKRLLIFSTFLFVIQNTVSQQNFFVYKVKGQPYIEVNGSVKSITKGSVIDKNAFVTMNRDDVLYFINNKGNIFELYNTGKFSYDDLQKIPAIKDRTPFSIKLSSYMWKEFTKNIAARRDKSGVVYRGDGIVLMKHPADSIKMYYSEIKFEWDSIKDKTKEYFFILKNLDTNTTTKIGTHSTSISLFIDGTILKEGDNYKWAITETKYPNDSKTVFYNFKVLNKPEFEVLEKEIKEISKLLKRLGFSKKEMRKVICQDYKICY